MMAWVIMVKGQFMSENALFTPMSEVSVSRSNWKLTFVIDLYSYEEMFRNSDNALKNIFTISQELLSHTSQINETLTIPFTTLYEQIKHLNTSRNTFLELYNNYKSLHNRQRRALIPFIGDLGSFLFGWAKDDDIHNIKQAVSNLNDNQNTLVHVVEKSLTIINKTRHDVRVNREQINKINSGIRVISGKLSIWSKQTSKYLDNLRKFFFMYAQIKDLIDTAQEIVFETVSHFNTLKAQIDMLSAGHVTPSSIDPKELRNILRDIDRKLPNTLQLPIDPDKHLWAFYKLMSSETIINSDKIFIIINLPLVNFLQRIDIFKIHNLPVTHPGMYANETSHKDHKHLTANYDIETNLIGVDKARTKYVLLKEEEAKLCLTSKNKFCKISSPYYPLNINKFCIIALFTGKNIRKFCKIKAYPNSILPIAEHIEQGLWLISMAIPMTFSITCDGGGKLKVDKLTLTPPLSTVKLQEGCIATSDSVTLPRYYEFSSLTKINQSFKVNQIKTSLWKPLESVVKPKLDEWVLPDLREIEEIEMSNLVKKVKSIKAVSIETGWKTEYTVLIVVCACSVISIALYITGRYLKWPFPGNFRKKKEILSTTEPRIEDPLKGPDMSEPEHNDFVSIPNSELKKETESVVPNYNIYPRV